MRENENRGKPQEPIPEWPRSEPEIIPPNGADVRSPSGSGVFVFVDQHGKTHRGTIGPFTIILALLAIGLVAGVILLVLFGVLLIWIPVIAVALAALLAFGTLRGYWRRLWNR